MLGVVKLYFKLAWFAKTPFVFLLDTNYKGLTLDEWKNSLEDFHTQSYVKEFYDCDDFSLVTKAFFSIRQINGIGIVWGSHYRYKFWKPSHFLNIILVNNSFYYLEPQTRNIFLKKKDWRTWGIVF